VLHGRIWLLTWVPEQVVLTWQGIPIFLYAQTLAFCNSVHSDTRKPSLLLFSNKIMVNSCIASLICLGLRCGVVVCFCMGSIKKQKKQNIAILVFSKMAIPFVFLQQNYGIQLMARGVVEFLIFFNGIYKKKKAKK
jgi:hypothetical protein